ncbi:MAG: hypothetical protein OSJ53_06635 [Kineothrix sp.]|nr:hypothetical protein [Kineothrix sp.]
MKILKGILTGIGVLTVLMCALILLSSVNPGITRTLSSLASGNGLPSKEEEEPEEERGGQDSFVGQHEDNFPDMLSQTEEEPEISPEENAEEEPETDAGEDSEETSGERVQRQPEEPERETSGDVSGDQPVRGTNGYEVPEESGVKVPEAVSGKSGYQPITEKSEQLPDAEGGEYTSNLGYGETGDGLAFDAVLYPYYQMLDAKGQHLYRQIFANATVLNEAFVPIEAVPVAELKNVIMAVYNDHPELFWLNTVFTCKYDQNKICAELALEFNLTKEELAEASSEFYNEANAILTRLQNLSDYEKEIRLHDILIEKIEYVKGADKNQSAYSALVEGKSVCAGYARAYQYLMQRLGIPCYYCTGYAGQDHAWNIVWLDDGFYNVDVTWDDTEGGEYDYFNKTDEEYADTHVRRDLSVNLPKCEGRRYALQ